MDTSIWTSFIQQTVFTYIRIFHLLGGYLTLLRPLKRVGCINLFLCEYHTRLPAAPC